MKCLEDETLAPNMGLLTTSAAGATHWLTASPIRCAQGWRTPQPRSKKPKIKLPNHTKNSTFANRTGDLTEPSLQKSCFFTRNIPHKARHFFLEFTQQI